MSSIFKEQKGIIKVWLVISMVFTLLGIVAGVNGLRSTDSSYVCRQIVMIVMYLLIVLYAIFGYKKPHGNLLKWLFIVYDLSNLFVYNNIIIKNIGANTSTNDQIVGILHLIIMLAVIYVAGRLDKIKQNRIIMSVILVILIYEFISTFIAITNPFNSFLVAFSYVSPTAMWIVLCTAYFARYKQHKLAGLQDK